MGFMNGSMGVYWGCILMKSRESCMKTVRKTVSVLLVCAIAFAFAGCKKDKKISAEDFRSKMEAESFTVSEGNAPCKTCLEAHHSTESGKTVTIIYYEYSSAENAKSKFDSQKKSFENAGKGDSVIVSTSSDRLRLENDSVLRITVFVDDMIVEAFGSDKDTLKSAMKALGY